MLLESRLAQPTTESEAIAMARELYHLEVAAQALPGEYDDNFHLSTPDQRALVLKVMHPAREAAFIEMQALALEHLAERLPHRPLPRVIPNKSGELFTAVPSPGGAERIVWLLTYVPGDTLAKAHPHSPELLESVGRLLGEIDTAFLTFSHPAAHRDLKWDSARAGWIAEAVNGVENDEPRALLKQFLKLYEAEVLPALPALRRGVIYGDANDHNVLVSEAWPQPREARTVIDFGDMHYGLEVSEPAIAAAYAMLGKNDPLSAAASIISGYHKACPIEEAEIKVLFPLAAMRLAVSVVMSAQRKRLRPADPYLTVSEAPAWQALAQLSRINPRFAHCLFRHACALPAEAKSAAIREHLRSVAPGAAPLVGVDLASAPVQVFDLSAGSLFLGADPASAEVATISQAISAELQKDNAAIGIGRYNEPRALYASALFQTSSNPTDERRTIHLGLDLFAAANTPVHAPLAGTIEAFAINARPLDYGPVVILKHAAGPGEDFYTLYGHLSLDSLKDLSIGQRLRPGEKFAAIGSAAENGGWPPHLHFQIITDLLDLGTDFPGVAPASQRGIWTSLCPDPNLVLAIPQKYFPVPEPGREETLSARKASLGGNLSLSYDAPVKMVRGWRQYLYDHTGRAFLDVYNNVALVGHSHPRVVHAAQAQLALLNTNTRYLHDNITRYAERLRGLLPAPLAVCFFLNSGSEANELAVRLARTHSKREDIVVLEHAYHGHTSALIDISPYKFSGPGGGGRKPGVHVAPLPDDYRGEHRRDDPGAGKKYAAMVGRILEETQRQNRPAAAFIAETLPSVGGQIVFPAGYL
ncbi:MAG: aminotransferase class III-fold pyridoxal phosphate-dependent enzyme, partial [Candidatus Acidiferrum sp.]